MVNGKAKGNQFERDICKRLSLWWTEGVRDDVFWRSQSSGGRATQRYKKGKDTLGQYGDIAAVDDEGAALIDIVTIEIKRGYNTASAHELLDSNAKNKLLESHLKQAILSWQQSGSLSWWLITKRDRKETVLWMPTFIWKEFRKKRPSRMLIVSNDEVGHVTGILFDEFLETTPPKRDIG